MGYSDILHINRISCINPSVCAVEKPPSILTSASMASALEISRVLGSASKKGDLFWTSPQTYHSLRALGPSKCLSYIFGTSFLRRIMSQNLCPTNKIMRFQRCSQHFCHFHRQTSQGSLRARRFLAWRSVSSWWRTASGANDVGKRWETLWDLVKGANF